MILVNFNKSYFKYIYSFKKFIFKSLKKIVQILNFCNLILDFFMQKFS